MNSMNRTSLISFSLYCVAYGRMTCALAISLYQTCLRDQVAAQASQSQAEKTKKSLKNRLYHAERKLPCVMQELSQAVVEREQNYDRLVCYSLYTYSIPL